MTDRLRTPAVAAFLLLASSLLLAAPKPAQFGGKWTLDRAQSKNLPPMYDYINAHVLDVKQGDATIQIVVTIATKEHGDDKFDFTYNLDGTETKSEAMMRTPDGPKKVPTTLTAKPQDNGDLAITIARNIDMGDHHVTGTTNELWHLGADGKTLSVHRVDEGPRGRKESDLVFVKG